MLDCQGLAAGPLATPPSSLLFFRNWAINSPVHPLLGFPLLALTVLNCSCPPSSSHLSWRKQEPVHPFHFPVTNLSRCPPPGPHCSGSVLCLLLHPASFRGPRGGSKATWRLDPIRLPLCLPWTASLPSPPTSHSSPLSHHIQLPECLSITDSSAPRPSRAPHSLQGEAPDLQSVVLTSLPGPAPQKQLSSYHLHPLRPPRCPIIPSTSPWLRG